MTFWSRLFCKSVRPARASRRSRRPQLECLEERLAPAADVLVANAITTNGAFALVDNAQVFTPSGDSAIVDAAEVAAFLDAGMPVVISTGTAGTQAGNITVASDIVKSAGGGTSLVFQADNTIALQGASIISRSGPLQVIVNSDRDASSAGAIALVNSRIESNGADIVLGGGTGGLNGSAFGTAQNPVGVLLLDTQLMSAGAGIFVAGRGWDDPGSGGHDGVLIESTAVGNHSGLDSSGGNAAVALQIAGIGGAGTTGNDGIELRGPDARIRAEHARIRLQGLGGAGTGNFNRGIVLEQGAEVNSTGSFHLAPGVFSVELNGTGGAGTISLFGVHLVDAGSGISAVEGAVDLVGMGGNGASTRNYGVVLFDGSHIVSTGLSADAATVTIRGVAGNGTDLLAGVVLSAGASIASQAGKITVTGTGGSSLSNSDGIALEAGASIVGNGSADVALNGFAGSGNNDNIGVRLDNDGTRVTVSDGNLTVTGAGSGNGAGDRNVGVAVLTGAVLGAMGSGDVLVIGTGGAGVSQNVGVAVQGPGAMMIGNSSVMLTGTGGQGIQESVGVAIVGGGVVTARGTGNTPAIILVSGVGGGGFGGNFGVAVDLFGTIQVENALVAVIGTAGAGVMTEAIEFGTQGPGAIIATGAEDIVILVGDSIRIDTQAAIQAAGVALTPATVGHAIDLGGADSRTALGLTDEELDRIATTNLIVGTDLNGTIDVTAALQHASDANFGLTSGRNILLHPGSSLTTVDGDLTLVANMQDTPSAGIFAGIFLDGATIATTGRGNVLLQGRGGDETPSFSLVGILITTQAQLISASAVADAGTITLQGVGGMASTGASGIIISDRNTLVSSVSGAIRLAGTGGAATGSVAAGVEITNGATVSSTGVGADAATILVEAMGGTAAVDSAGAFVIAGAGSDGSKATLATVDGAIRVIGRGGMPPRLVPGISINANSVIRSTGTGSIELDGTAGEGQSEAVGVSVGKAEVDAANDPAGQVSVTDGTLMIRGVGAAAGTGDRNVGVVVHSGALVSSIGLGAIEITGTGGAGTDQLVGVAVRDAGTGDGGSHVGVAIQENSRVLSLGAGPGVGAVSVRGTGGAGTENNVGVVVFDEGSKIESVSGDIQVVGQGGMGSGSDQIGVLIGDGAVIASRGVGLDAASITIDGVGGTGSERNFGVALGYQIDALAQAAITSVDGDVQLTGSAGQGPDSEGIALGVANPLFSQPGGGIVLTGRAQLTMTSDSVRLDAPASINALTSVTINVDLDNQDPGRGGVVTIASLITAGLVQIRGGSDDDLFRLVIVTAPTSILAGDGADLLVFADGATLVGGIIDGGSGVDLLDYSAYATAVAANLSNNRLFGLAPHTATGAGGVYGIENVDGGSANDVLVGDGEANRLLGLAGDDCIVGHGGNDFLSGDEGNDVLLGGKGNDVLHGGSGRDILIGGPGFDRLVGGADGDILIGGSTIHDANAAALRAILAEWKRIDVPFLTRIQHLRRGGGLNRNVRLTKSTFLGPFQVVVDPESGDNGMPDQADWIPEPLRTR